MNNDTFKQEGRNTKYKIKNYIGIIWTMTEKEIKARYKRAVFGYLWVALNPLLQMLIIGSIFTFFIKIPNYFLFLFVGLLPWQFFSLSLSKATPSIVYERSLLQKAKFPIEAIPTSIILSNFFNMVISFILLFIVLFFLGKLTAIGLIFSLLLVIWLLIFTVGISLLTASLQVRYRDISFFVQTILTLWFYATPVLYNLTLIPENLRHFFSINPLTSIIEYLHYFLLNQGQVSQLIFIANIVLSFIILLLGIYLFNKEKRFFVDWL